MDQARHNWIGELPNVAAGLAKANGSAASDSALAVVVMGLMIVGVTAVIGAVPAVIARRRGHRHIQGFFALMILWSALAGGVTIYTYSQRMTYAREHQEQVMQMESDPSDASDAPAWPRKTWMGLAVVYAGLISWAAIARPTPGTSQIDPDPLEHPTSGPDT